jgi:pimeloyl-ACP methyl ester carboxylesterase
MQIAFDRHDLSRQTHSRPAMMDSNHLTKQFIDTEIDGVHLRVAAMHREGRRPPIVFLHGFGSTKEDYADVAFYPQFDDRRIIAFDAPGCGETECGDLSVLSIPFLQQTAKRVLQHYGVERFHLVGHSMGGLTALLLACDSGNAIQSFTNIKGNLAPEDCFLSRQILEHPSDDPNEFMKLFVERAWEAQTFSSPLFASALPYKVRPEAVSPIFRSMVDLSENDALLAKFTGLSCAKMFVYGDQYRSLSYLGTLMKRGVQLAEIERSGHFPMYANPSALWARLSAFIDRSEVGPSHE